MVVAAMYGADQRISEQFGVQYLAQRHFHMETRRRYPDIRYLRITRRWLYIWAPAATTEAVSSTVVAVYILLRFQSCRTTVANQTNMFVTCVSFNNYSHIRPTEVTSGLCYIHEIQRSSAVCLWRASPAWVALPPRQNRCLRDRHLVRHQHC